jgi:prolyl-tRNA synthetase
MMGGSVAHEFMAVTEAGEDSLVICTGCDYAANNEVAEARVPDPAAASGATLAEIATPGVKTIEALCAFLGIEARQTAKAVFYAVDRQHPSSKRSSTELVFCLVRGDREINEIKLAKAVGSAAVRFATDQEIRALGAVPGYASPVGLDLAKSGCKVLVDPFLERESGLVTGANKEDYHLTGFVPQRDLPPGYVVADVTKVQSGDHCKACGAALSLTRGIEIGNIFQLGTKYTDAMGMRYLDHEGKAHGPIMGCYGIGVGRLMAAAVEEHHDEHGPVWPLAIAPFEVHLCALMLEKPEVRETAERLYAELTKQGLEVIFDDTANKAGFQFADADLIGVPIRLVVAPKALQRGVVEFKLRDGTVSGEWPVADVVAKTLELRSMLAKRG